MKSSNNYEGGLDEEELLKKLQVSQSPFFGEDNEEMLELLKHFPDSVLNDDDSLDDLVDYYESLINEERYQSKRLNRIYRGLLEVNSNLLALADELHVSNLVRLYDLDCISRGFLENSLDDVYNFRLDGDFGEE